MIDHVSIQVRDLAARTVFYERVLEPLGLTLLVTRDHTVGFGKRYPEFWLNHRPGMPSALDGTGAHVCFRAGTREAVDEFHRSALEMGGQCDGAPGERQATMTTNHGAFVLDSDRNRIEAITFPRT